MTVVDFIEISKTDAIAAVRAASWTQERPALRGHPSGRGPVMTSDQPAPSKCHDQQAAGVTPNPCRAPGQLLRCQLCPASETFWRRSASPNSEGT